MLQKDQPKTSAYHLPSTTLSNFFFSSFTHQPRYWVALNTKPWTTPSDLRKWWRLTDDLPRKMCIYSPFSRRFRDARWTRSPQWARGFIQTACHIAMVTCPPSSHLFPHSHDSIQIIREQVAVVMRPNVWRHNSLSHTSLARTRRVRRSSWTSYNSSSCWSVAAPILQTRQKNFHAHEKKR